MLAIFAKPSTSKERAKLRTSVFNLTAIGFCVSLFVGCAKDDSQTEVAPEAKASSAAEETNSPAKKRPNFLLIVADDLGYSDIGVFGGEIGTPNLDTLASSGIQLTNFHTAPTCSPTRSMLLSGTDNHLAGMGGMAEFLRHVAPQLLSKPGYEGYLNKRVAALPEVLLDAGYRTYMAGKWHIGDEEGSFPSDRGFEKTFTMLEGGAGHLSNMNVVPFSDRKKALYLENGKPADLPEGFYSTQFYADKLINYLKTDKNSDKPFFAYLAFTAPHWPLQAPESSIEKFKGAYDEGYEALFDRRLARQKELGLLDESVQGLPLLPNSKPWAELSDDERKRSVKLMEIYAAMVSDMDEYIGKVIQTLKDLGEYENTVIFFMSDNGAEGSNIEKILPGLDKFLERCCDNSYENMGKANSYLSYGAEWARAGASPSKYYKSMTTQGGILAPAIVSYPSTVSSAVRYDEFLSVMDVMPTFLALADITPPAGQFQGREALPIKGQSISPVLHGKLDPIHGENYVMGWELHNRRAIRQGDWKLVFTGPPLGDSQWELYDLAADPAESNNLSEANPAKVAELLALWDDYVEQNGVQVLGAK